MTRISIAMATYNGARYIAEQLASLAAQTHRPHELVVCDDGSTDATVEAVEAFATTAAFPVRVHRNETNLGYVRNFLKAAGLCEGDWIAFCDQDDVWAPEKLALVARAAARRRDAVLVVHPAEVVDEALKPLGRSVPRLPRRRVIGPLGHPPWLKVPGFCCTFDARLVRNFPHDRLPPNLFADGRAQTADKRILWLANVLGATVVLHRPLALYRRHSANVSGLASAPQERGAPAPDHDALRARVLGEYAEELRRFADLDQAGDFRRRLLSGADHHARRAGWHAQRLSLFGPSPAGRLAGFGRLLAGGAYWGRGGRGLGLRACVRDGALAAGLVRPAAPSPAGERA